MQPLDSSKFVGVKPALDELLKPLCPAGYRFVLLILEPVSPDDPHASFTHMVSDIHDNAGLAGLLASIATRLHAAAGPAPDAPPVH